MEFERVARGYPRVANRAAALLAFDAAVRERGITRVVDTVTAKMQERGANEPDLTELLREIERTRPRMSSS